MSVAFLMAEDNALDLAAFVAESRSVLGVSASPPFRSVPLFIISIPLIAMAPWPSWLSSLPVSALESLSLSSPSVTLEVPVLMLKRDCARVYVVATDLSVLFLEWILVIDTLEEKLYASITPSFASPKEIALALYALLATSSLRSLSNRPRVMS